MWKLSIDIAERKDALFRRALRSAERLSDSATARGLPWVKTPFSRSSALLVRITRADQRRALVLGMSFPLSDGVFIALTGAPPVIVRDDVLDLGDLLEPAQRRAH